MRQLRIRLLPGSGRALISTNPLRRCETGDSPGVVSGIGLVKGHMRRRGDQVEWNQRPARSESAEQNHATALQRVLDNNAEELLWLAEVMVGSRQAGEQCIAETVQLAETAQYVG